MLDNDDESLLTSVFLFRILILNELVALNFLLISLLCGELLIEAL